VYKITGVNSRRLIPLSLTKKNMVLLWRDCRNLHEYPL